MVSEETWEVFWCYDFWDVLYDRCALTDVESHRGLSDSLGTVLMPCPYSIRVKEHLPGWCTLRRVNPLLPLHEQVSMWHAEWAVEWVIWN
jgi:hypothetical protein